MNIRSNCILFFKYYTSNTYFTIEIVNFTIEIVNIFKIQISTATPSSSIPSGGQIITTKDPKTGKSIQQLVQTVTDPKTGKSTQVKVPLPNGTQQGIIMMKSCLAQFNCFDGRSDHQQDMKNKVSKVKNNTFSQLA